MAGNLKKDIVYSLILGEASSLFLIFVVKNPFIEEFKQLAVLHEFIWWLPVVLPLLFLAGILKARLLSKFARIFYQFAKFLEIGVLNTMIDFGVLNLLIWLTGITGGLAIAPLNAASFLLATTNSYFWNKFWTFGVREVRPQRGEVGPRQRPLQFIQFLAISAIGIGINTGIVVAGTSLISPGFDLSAGAWANVMKVLATAVSMIWNFLGYKFIVFK